MQTALRRRLRWPLSIAPGLCSGRSCRHRLDARGDHRAACSRAGLLAKRTLPLERMWTRILREGGARVDNNVMLRDTALPHVGADDNRRLEIIATGLPIARGVPSAAT